MVQRRRLQSWTQGGCFLSSGREGVGGRRKRKQVIQSPVKHISQYFHNIVFHLSESKRSKVIAIESSSQSTLELSTTILSTKLVNQNKKPFNMSTIVANPMQPEATKIEKLEAKLARFEESSEKEEKLRAKLRYLQFFENFQVATTPAHFVCSECKEVEVVRKEVLHLTHKEAPQVKTSYKKEVEVQCLSQETHKKEWQEQEKSRQEGRQEIRREFNKQEQGRGRRTKQEKDKDLVKLSQGDFNVKPNSLTRVPATTTSGRPPTADQEKEQKATVGKEGKLLHGDCCKTCVRMDKLMGQVLPHSPNY